MLPNALNERTKDISKPRLEKRWARLMPNNLPKWVRCYDNGGPDKEEGSIDRYTVVFTGNYSGRARNCMYLSMSGAPFHPQGVGQHGEHDRPIDRPAYGHLGKKIHFTDLPEDCQVLVLRDYFGLWDFTEDTAEQDGLILAEKIAKEIVGARIKAQNAVPV